MGVAVWYFERPEPGIVRALSGAAVRQFAEGRRASSACADGFVYLIEVSVECHDRVAQHVVRIACFRHRVDPDGLLDPEHLRQVMGTAAEAVAPAVARGALPGLIPAERRFAQRRLEHLSGWELSAEEASLLERLVNDRAGRPLLWRQNPPIKGA